MRTKLRSKTTLLFIVFGLLLAIPAVALASDLNGSVVDTTAPEGSVTLSPGNSGNIAINMSVTGKQDGTATFKVYKDWTLSGGSFTGSNPQTFTVNPRPIAGAPATTFSIDGTVSVDSNEAAGGPFTLNVGAFDITNTNDTGAKLTAREFSTYQVSVQGISDPCASVTDPAAPVISSNPANPDGLLNWFKTIPTVSASSSTSGATITYATEVNGGAKSSYSATAPTLGQGETIVYAKATSATCNRISESSKTFLVDTIDPAVDPGNVVNNVWRNTSLSQAFTASDNGSGLADSADADFTLTASDESTDADTPTVVSKTVSDKAGNSTTRSVSAKIDLTKPSLGIVDGNAASYNVCGTDRPSEPSFSPSDGLSGLASSSSTWTPNLQPSGVGSYTYSAQAQDNASNSNSYGPKTYKVVFGSAYGGVTQPINGGSTIDLSDDNSRFKVGSTVPVKFKLMCGTTPIDNAVANLNVKKADGTPDPGVDEAISTAASTTGNLFRYDSLSGQYIFNLSTKSGYTNPSGTTITSFTAGTYTLSVILDDGTSRSVNINLVR